jgi:GxxExxY protein
MIDKSMFYPYKDVVFKIIGAAMEVQNELRWGLLESVYNESLCMELDNRGIECKPEEYIPCYYKKKKLNKSYKIDIVVGDVIVELKSTSDILSAHRAQLFNYLRLTRRPIGLLINFGTEKLQGERYGYIEETNECVLLNRNMDIIYDPIDWSP